MEGKMFMRVEEVAEELDVSIPFIRKMNEELKKTGHIDRKFFYEKFYGTKEQTERSV